MLNKKDKKKKLYSKNQFCYKCYKESGSMRKLYKLNDGTGSLFCDVHGYNGECTNCKADEFKELDEGK